MEIRSNMSFEDLIPYCIFPNSFIRNGKIPPQQKVLFEILCSYDHVGSDGKRKGWCEPSLDKIAEQMGLKKRAVQTHLKRLVEAGMVVIVYRNIIPDAGRTSLYILNILPGLSEADRKRIALTRNIEIKHKISGLNTIKVQTAKGMIDVSEKEFDLEYIITGNRSSTILEADGIVDPEEIISKAQESLIKDKELYEFCGEQLKQKKAEINLDDDMEGLSFGRKIVMKKKTKGPGWSSEDPIVRITAGNYDKVTPREICVYFKHLVEITYPGLPYIIEWKNNKDPNIISNRLEQYDVDVFIPMMEHFIKNYERLFYDPKYPKPAIWHLSQTWIINKLSADFEKTMKTQEQMDTVEERPTASGEQMMF